MLQNPIPCFLIARAVHDNESPGARAVGAFCLWSFYWHWFQGISLCLYSLLFIPFISFLASFPLAHPPPSPLQILRPVNGASTTVLHYLYSLIFLTSLNFHTFTHSHSLPLTCTHSHSLPLTYTESLSHLPTLCPHYLFPRLPLPVTAPLSPGWAWCQCLVAWKGWWCCRCCWWWWWS